MGYTALISFPSKDFFSGCYAPLCGRNKEEEEKWEEDGRVVLLPIKCMEILGVSALLRRGSHLLYLPTIPYLLVHLLIENQLLCVFSKDKTTWVGFREPMRIVSLDGWTIIYLLKVV